MHVCAFSLQVRGIVLKNRGLGRVWVEMVEVRPSVLQCKVFISLRRVKGIHECGNKPQVTPVARTPYIGVGERPPASWNLGVGEYSQVSVNPSTSITCVDIYICIQYGNVCLRVCTYTCACISIDAYT